jgi:hypothetical protein
MKRYHITKPHGGERWQFREEGAQRALQSSDTKQEAIDRMRDYMSDKTGSVKIHLANGPIQEERTYQRSDDPRRSKG